MAHALFDFSKLTNIEEARWSAAFGELRTSVKSHLTRGCGLHFMPALRATRANPVDVMRAT